MAHDVFISHSAKDKVTGDAVCAMLESNGIRCWIAPRDVTPGMEWGECIIQAIKKSRIMVLVFSAHANESPQIRREIERAVNHGVTILPLRIEDVQPGTALEYFIGNVHWLDALTPPLENHLKNLAGTVKVLLERMGPREPGPIPHGSRAPEPATNDSTSPTAPIVTPPLPIFAETLPSAETKKPSGRRWLRITLISAAVVIFLLLVLEFFIPSGRQRIVRNPGRLKLALVASFAPNQTGAPLLNYDGSPKVYGIERELTAPGDIESVAATTDGSGMPALEIRLNDAGVKRINSGASIVDHDMALVLNDRTILATARIQSALGSAIAMSGSLSSDDINRLLDAISSGDQNPTRPPPETKDWKKEAFSKVDAAAKEGVTEALYELGDRYYSGRDGAKKDYVQALGWLQKAGDKGSADAQFRLGGMYLFGIGVSKDPAQAVAWYKKAADQGDIKSENNLGAMYQDGTGVPKDDAEALMWFRKAADQGSAVAQTNIGNLYCMDPSKPRDFAKAFFWYRKAADQGYAAAESQLGELYQYGNGVPKNLVQAMKWYQKAADQGDAGAKQRLANLEHGQ